MRFPASFADHAIRFSRLPAYRSEHLPDAGPPAWLDRQDALGVVATKQLAHEITIVEAEMCRNWVTIGYLIVRKLFDPATLDAVWHGYERAFRSRRIRLPAEPAGERDPWPGRSLSPHRKSSSFCRILKEPSLLRVLHLILGHDLAAARSWNQYRGTCLLRDQTAQIRLFRSG